MDNIFTEVEVRKLSAPRPSKPGVKAWAGSLVALGLIAAGVIAAHASWHHPPTKPQS